MANDVMANTMRAHHASMSREVNRLADALWNAPGDWQSARDQLVHHLTTEVIPHARAEEETVYAAGRQCKTLVGLVRSMVYEHEVIGSLRDRLAQATEWRGAADVASKVAQLFLVHAEKEDRFVIAALEPSSDVDLGAVLGDMHKALAGDLPT